MDADNKLGESKFWFIKLLFYSLIYQFIINFMFSSKYLTAYPLHF